MNRLLAEKVAIVTGGGRGIGKAIALRFAQEGCNLVLVSRTSIELEQTAEIIKKKFPVKVSVFEIDISHEAEVLSMAQKVYKDFGKISILINNAAIIGPIGEVSQIDGTDFLETLNINIGGTFFCTKAVIPYMKSQKIGCIINLSGGGGLNAFPYYDAYSASKSAIVRLTENFSLELEKFNINVTAISPGAVNTQMFFDQLKVDQESLGEKNWMALQNQLISGGESVDKAAELTLFLACQKGKEFSGRVISAIWDNWEDIAKKKEKIVNSDIFNMRRIVPKDREVEI